MGSSGARYLRSFARGGTLFTRFHAQHHPSLPNYLQMTSGHTSGCRSDDCPKRRYRTNNLFRQLSNGGVRWEAWAESMGSRCGTVTRGRYASWHNPPLYYRNLFPRICRHRDVPYPRRLPRVLPRFVFAIPDSCHDMHDFLRRRGQPLAPASRAAVAAPRCRRDHHVRRGRHRSGRWRAHLHRDARPRGAPRQTRWAPIHPPEPPRRVGTLVRDATALGGAPRPAAPHALTPVSRRCTRPVGRTRQRGVAVPKMNSSPVDAMSARQPWSSSHAASVSGAWQTFTIVNSRPSCSCRRCAHDGPSSTEAPGFDGRRSTPGASSQNETRPPGASHRPRRSHSPSSRCGRDVREEEAEEDVVVPPTARRFPAEDVRLLIAHARIADALGVDRQDGGGRIDRGEPVCGPCKPLGEQAGAARELEDVCPT